MKRQSPKIEPRQFSDVLKALQQMAPHYTPEWPAQDEDDSGVALLKIFSRIAEHVTQRLNQTPDKNFAAFLDMLGIGLLPARPSRAPVQFRLVEGTPGSFLIPAKTQLTADTTEERPEPLPFETEQSLQASASPLRSVISIDPGEDAIYKPPPGFLGREFPSQNLPRYNLISFSESGSKTIQLDRIDELEEGDYLKIGQDGTLDYLIIESISGRIVTVTDALQHNYSATTKVEKITRFHLFEGKNHQAHILYLGHPDLFNIKSSTRFTLDFTHIAAPVGLQRLSMVWEYWSADEDEEGEDWQAFEIESDISQGFSQNGAITLRKPEGEIKEREINATPSRWIRCRLAQALPVPEFPLLPELDKITFLVESAGDPQPPDQAFHNDTQLDVALPFFPFGIAPRIFDSFYLASQEAFSKKNAKIEIDVRVDTSKILATPAAILFQDETNQQRIKVFARSVGGRLIEAELDVTTETGSGAGLDATSRKVNWFDHQFPPDTKIALPNSKDGFESVPSVVANPSGGTGNQSISVFVKTEDNRLAEFSYQGGKAEWKTIHAGIPNGVIIKYDLSTVRLDNNTLFVFAVGADGRLYIFNGTQWSEESHRPRETDIASSPYAITIDNMIKVFVRGQNGQLYEWNKNNGTTWIGYKLSANAMVNSRPFAQMYKYNDQYYAKVFVTDNSGNLHLLDAQQSADVSSQSLGSPTSDILVGSHPHGFIFDIGTDREKQHIFVRGTDNRLWEWTNDQMEGWKAYQNLQDIDLHLSPSIIYYDQQALFVFSSTSKNSLLEAAPISYAAGGGKDNGLITLRTNAPDQRYEGLQIEIRAGAGAGQMHEITHYDSSIRTATIDGVWDTVPDESSEYHIWGAETTVRDSIAPSITLAESTSTVAGAYVGRDIRIVSGSGEHQSATIVEYEENTKVATLDTAWDVVPGVDSGYQLNTAHTGTVQTSQVATITLAPDALTNDGVYNRLTLEIIDSNDVVVQTRTIRAYDGDTRTATVAAQWVTAPDNTFSYRLPELVGTARGGTNNTIILAESASMITGAYVGRDIRIVSGSGEHQSATITEYEGDTRVATINRTWDDDDIPDTTSGYQLNTAHTGTVQASQVATITLAPDALTNDGVYNRLTLEIIDSNDVVVQTRTIRAYDGDTRTATVAAQWVTAPDNTFSYRLPELVGTARGGIAATITLAADASSSPVDYVGHLIKIVSGVGLGQEAEIIGYDSNRNIAALKTEISGWKEVPTLGSVYQITADSGNAQGGKNPSYILLNKISASTTKGIYNNKYIKIVGGQGSDQNTKRIVDYSGGKEKRADIATSWEADKEPDNTSRYRIEGDALWIAHSDPNSTSNATEAAPQLSWEYWNDHGWVAFKQEHDFKDGTQHFFIDGTIEFTLPGDITSTEVSGQENHWIRARLVGGDYGQETFLLEEKNQNGVKTLELVSKKDSLIPPQIFSITVRYQLIERQFPKQCLTFNNLEYIDQTSACQTSGKRFEPFSTLEDTEKGMYLGFEQRLVGGPVRMFFAAQELSFSEQTKPTLTWCYRRENEWQRLSAEDDTEGLIKQELLTLLVPQDFTRVNRFGDSLFWIRGSLSRGAYDPGQLPVLAGIFPNTAWTFQAETIEEEILGSSNGQPQQTVQFFKSATLPTPTLLPKPSILPGEKVRVREALSDEERTALIDKLGEQAVHDVKDDDGKIIETWVLWSKVSDFFQSSSADRHYTLDHATGQLQFGDGRQGRIPSAGSDNIKAFAYQAGGGVAGNVAAGQIQTLATAIAGVESARNLVASDGGSDTATLEETLQTGPSRISHRDRAVTSEDFEWLAREASRKVVKVRCLPNTDNTGRRVAGWVTLIIVPDIEAPKPMPSIELRAAVRRYLQAHCAHHIADPGHIVVNPPIYTDVGVDVTIYVESPDVASQVENEARAKLQRFLHPLNGGPEEKGWEFGRNVTAADVYVLLEKIKGVDHVESLVFRANGNVTPDLVRIEPNALVASAEHNITVNVQERR